MGLYWYRNSLYINYLLGHQTEIKFAQICVRMPIYAVFGRNWSKIPWNIQLLHLFGIWRMWRMLEFIGWNSSIFD